MRKLYSPIEPYNKGRLKVSQLHAINYEQSGNPHGKILLLLHGGPGAGSRDWYRQYFDSRKWRIITFDQRGCGKSTPHGELTDNTTWDLVNDIEKLRKHLDVEKWVISGGSWGCTLSLAYSQSYPENCQGLILYGIFLCRQSEIRWLYQQGASYIYPDIWQEYLKSIPLEERENLLLAFYKRLTSRSKITRINAARTWTIWEATISKLIVPPKIEKISVPAAFAEALARIECHYFINKGFLKSENQLIKGINKIRHIPGIIIQGRYDMVCPMITAWELHKAWSEAELIIVPDSGHSLREPGMADAIIEAGNRFATLQSKLK